MKPQLKRTLLTTETVLDYFKSNPGLAKYYCSLHSDYLHQFEDGSWNEIPPTDEQLTCAADWFVENHFGVDGRVATDEECDAIRDGKIRLV